MVNRMKEMYDVIATKILRDIKNADGVNPHIVRYPEDVIDPRSAPLDPEADRIRYAIAELVKAITETGEPRRTYVRTARVILGSIVPDEEI